MKAAPPPPPKEWYEELLSPEFFTSIEFMAGAGVLLLVALGFVLWRRRKAGAES
jgi:LPXTG-motif cell wall-anchored protein